MTARMWRGWAAADTADEVIEDLRGGALARLAATPGYVSTQVLVRPAAGGVEILTLTLWESGEAVPARVEEDHELLVARQTVVDCWEIAAPSRAIAQAA
jgi:hypothetical protein